jgi:mannose-6-phosphate isomerase-like protein (cupin superfamily)
MREAVSLAEERHKSVDKPRNLVHYCVNYLERKKSMAKRANRSGFHLRPNAGRSYPMGPVEAIFKADGAETNGKYSISEWWLEPKTRGPGAHSHDEDDVFYVLEGTMSFRIGTRWIEAPKGSFVIAPGGMKHDFENRTTKRAGMLNVSVPGDFEPHMRGIQEWFANRSPADAATKPRRRATKR